MDKGGDGTDTKCYDLIKVKFKFIMISLNSLVRLGLFIIVVITLTLFLVFGWSKFQSSMLTWFNQPKLPSAHLIPHVNYFGVYTNGDLVSQDAVAVRTILDYWGNSEISDELIINTLSIADENDTAKLEEIRASIAQAGLFIGAGYELLDKATSSPAYIKYLIANNIPVYVKQRLGENYMDTMWTTRVYIGYSDKEKHFIVHDSDFGNNYLISYSEYEKISPRQLTLMVHPKGYELSDKPSHASAQSTDYPERSAIMDDLELREVIVKLMEANFYRFETILKKEDNLDKIISLYEEVINHPAFVRLHPVAQMRNSFNLAYYYGVEKKDYVKGIETLEKVTLPVIENFDFSKSYNGWPAYRDPTIYEQPFFNAMPWARLGDLYLRVNEPAKAREAYLKALEYQPDFADAKDRLPETE